MGAVEDEEFLSVLAADSPTLLGAVVLAEVLPLPFSVEGALGFLT